MPVLEGKPSSHADAYMPLAYLIFLNHLMLLSERWPDGLSAATVTLLTKHSGTGLYVLHIFIPSNLVEMLLLVLNVRRMALYQ